VFQVFLTKFLIDSGYKTPIQNMDELYDSGIKLAYPRYYSFILETGDETDRSKVHRNLANCPSFWDCLEWTTYHKNVSFLVHDIEAEILYALGDFISEDSKPLLCGLEDGVFFPTSLTMMMLHGDPLLRRVNEIIDRVVEAGIYNYWISLKLNSYKLSFRKIAIVQQLDEYYSFNLYHMQPAFCLLLMGWCLSALCFMFEVLYNCVLSKIM
jgi:hypothetical protein